MSSKSIAVKIPPLVLKGNVEMECWREFILCFEIALTNTNIATIYLNIINVHLYLEGKRLRLA